MERMRDPECFRAPLVERGPGCAGATDVGPQRVRNEDAYWIAEDAAALVVADGLGGLPAGDVASALAVAGAAGFLADALASSSRRGGSSSKRARHEDHRPEAGNGSPATPEARLGRLAHDAAVQAQRCVLEASRRRPELRGMATTLVVALVENRTAVILHIGDSRAVLWRAGQVVATTFDHNGVGDLLRSGALTPEQARRHPARNLVREVVGMPDGYQA
jgi:protein phosphatase